MRYEDNGKYTEIIVEWEDIKRGDVFAILYFLWQTFWGAVILYAVIVAVIKNLAA